MKLRVSCIVPFGCPKAVVPVPTPRSLSMAPIAAKRSQQQPVRLWPGKLPGTTRPFFDVLGQFAFSNCGHLRDALSCCRCQTYCTNIGKTKTAASSVRFVSVMTYCDRRLCPMHGLYLASERCLGIEQCRPTTSVWGTATISQLATRQILTTPNKKLQNRTLICEFGMAGSVYVESKSRHSATHPRSPIGRLIRARSCAAAACPVSHWRADRVKSTSCCRLGGEQMVGAKGLSS